jgi:hypothetical protein
MAAKQKPGRPKGHRLSKESRDKIALGVRATHARRTAELLLLHARAEAAAVK